MTISPLGPDDPQQIGRYRILGELGSGGMGRVLLGTGPDGRLVAVKQVHPHLLDEAKYRSRFRQEVAATARVSGAFTAPVIDFDVDSATPWLASVFVVGMPLDRAVEEYGPLPPTAVRRLAAGLASALLAIHHAGLIHRDLKPANILLAADGPRVIDFGIASVSENPSGLTETGSVLGSPAYMSPEQTLAERLTPASDVFSLGSVLILAATGTSPFASSSLAYTLFNIAHTQPNTESLPPDLRTLIEPCLHKDPAARPTPAQILDFLGDPLQHDLPWPEPVHHGIDRQHTELAALTADPNATSVLPGARRSTRLGTRSTPGELPARQGRGPRARALTALAMILVVAGVAAATVAWMGGGTTGPAEHRELTIAQVREVDSCAWIREALREPIPADIAGDFPTELSEWQLESSSFDWGCGLTNSGKNRYVNFTPGDDLNYTTMVGEKIPEGSFAAGQPILGNGPSSMCYRSVRTADSSPWGLTLFTEGSCRQLEYILMRLVAVDDIPRLPDAASSLASIDPCTLADSASLQPLIGTVPDTPSAVHSCEWTGSESVQIVLRPKSHNVDEDDPRIELGDGRQLIAQAVEPSGSCQLMYFFRPNGNDYETVEVTANGASGAREKLCAIAESVIRTAVDRLPR